VDGTAFWTLAVIAAFCVGLSKGGAPAFGALAVPILSLAISPVTAAGLLLPVFVFSDVFGLWAYRQHSDDFVRVLIGTIGLVFSLNFVVRRNPEGPPRPARTGPGLVWTTIAGFTSFVSHAGAPPWQVWVVPLRLPKMVFAGTSTAAFAIMNVLKIVPYYFLGQLQMDFD